MIILINHDMTMMTMVIMTFAKICKIGLYTDLNKIIKCKQLVGKLLKCLQIQFQNGFFFLNCEINPF